ncbi:MAG TPA: hypothetical protein VKR59_22260 [Terriglobales bacterium]|nr:hypothetical protein [Terriglobales bacterium]
MLDEIVAAAGADFPSEGDGNGNSAIKVTVSRTSAQMESIPAANMRPE